MKRVFFALVALVVSSIAVFAQSTSTPVDTIVNVPWGDWLFESAQVVIAVLGAVVMWGLRQLPARIVAVIQTGQLDQLLLRAIDFGINKTAGAAKGKTLNVDVGSEVLEQALQYAIDNAPKWMVAWAGGADGLRAKIIARLNLEGKAAV